MDSLKEFRYFDPTTGEPIDNPQVNLVFDSSGKPAWKKGKGRFAKNPEWWVVPETEGEKEKLSAAPLNGQTLSANQIPTNKKAAELVKAAKSKEDAIKAKKAAEQREADKQKAAEEAAQRRQSVVDNLAKSGVLQNETLKKAVNTSQIPIFNKDFARISKGINKVLATATKTKFLTDTYTADEGTSIEKGVSNSAEVSDIVKEVINNNLTVVKDATGKVSFVYSLKPISNMSEKKHAEARRLTEEETSGQTNEVTSGQPAQTTATTQPENQPPQQAGDQPNSQASDQSENASTQTSRDTSASVTLTSADMKLFKDELTAAIEPILSETLKTIADAAQSIRFHCSSIGAPAQEVPTSETEEAAKPQQESKDMRVLRRLLEDDKPSEVASVKEDSSEGSSTEKPADATDEEEVAKEAAAAAEAPKVPSFPGNKTLKTIIDQLNEKGNPFETSRATYKLNYKIDNISPEDRSFDIIVTSESTTPKEGFWSSFGKEAGKFLKAAGGALAKGAAAVANVIASDGRMTF